MVRTSATTYECRHSASCQTDWVLMATWTDTSGFTLGAATYPGLSRLVGTDQPRSRALTPPERAVQLRVGSGSGPVNIVHAGLNASWWKRAKEALADEHIIPNEDRVPRRTAARRGIGPGASEPCGDRHRGVRPPDRPIDRREPGRAAQGDLCLPERPAGRCCRHPDTLRRADREERRPGGHRCTGRQRRLRRARLRHRYRRVGALAGLFSLRDPAALAALELRPIRHAGLSGGRKPPGQPGVVDQRSWSVDSRRATTAVARSR